ncbi:MAG: hypothetical protein ABIB79_00295 [archaeon]
MIIRGEELENLKKRIGRCWNLFKISLPCHHGNPDNFEAMIKSPDFKPLKHLGDDLSHDAVLDYFLGLHNKFSYANAKSDPRWYPHMCVPYNVMFNDPVEFLVTNEFIDQYRNFPREYLENKLTKGKKRRMRQFDIYDPDKLDLGDLVHIHRGYRGKDLIEWIVNVIPKNER